MNPITHFLAGWMVANAPGLERRERAVVAIAGVVADFDGLGVVADYLTRHSAHPTNWWGEYHHVLGHNITFGVAVSACAWLTAAIRKRDAVGQAVEPVLSKSKSTVNSKSLPSPSFRTVGRLSYKWKVAALAFLSFHLHILGDLVGARGPEGEQWAIPYLNPFTDSVQLVWSGQWALNAWPNFAITFALLAAAFYLARVRGFSPLEIVSRRADAAFVEALRRRFPRTART
jgi:hypothetical protein